MITSSNTNFKMP